MAKTPQRKRKAGKRTNEWGRDDAVQFALDFLAQVASLERLERAASGEPAALGSTERKIVQQLAAVSGLDDFAERRLRDLKAFERVKAEVATVVDRHTRAMIRSAPSGYVKARKEFRFRGIYTAFAANRRVPQHDDWFNEDAAKPFARLQGTAPDANETALRARIAKELGTSERDVRRLQQKTGLRLRDDET